MVLFFATYRGSHNEQKKGTSTKALSFVNQGMTVQSLGQGNHVNASSFCHLVYVGEVKIACKQGYDLHTTFRNKHRHFFLPCAATCLF